MDCRLEVPPIIINEEQLLLKVCDHLLGIIQALFSLQSHIMPPLLDDLATLEVFQNLLAVLLVLMLLLLQLLQLGSTFLDLFSQLDDLG